jgi:hypothetical protein
MNLTMPSPSAPQPLRGPPRGEKVNVVSATRAFNVCFPGICPSLPSGSSIWPVFVLILIAGLLIFLRQSSLRWQRQNTSQRNLADLRIRQHEQVIVKTYKGSQAQAAKRFEDDSTEMAAHGYFPTSQSWAPGQWETRAFIIAVLLIFLFCLGLFILGYMLIVKPDGTLKKET